jgi:hypothetical protein
MNTRRLPCPPFLLTAFLSSAVEEVVPQVNANASPQPGCPHQPTTGGCADLPLPVQAAPGGRKVLMGGSVDEGLEVEVGRGHGDGEERPKECGARGGEAAVQLPARVLNLDLAEGGD